MTTYTAYFRTDAESATRDFVATTPEQALKKARRFYKAHADQLLFEPYDEIAPVNEIAIWSDQGDDLAVWLDDDLCLRLAAGELLEALKFIVADIEEGVRGKGAWLKTARAAIAKAKGGAA
jgi:hypothetical protein